MFRIISQSNHGLASTVPVLCLILLTTPSLLGETAETESQAPITTGRARQITNLWEQGGGKLDALNARIRDAYDAQALTNLNQTQGGELYTQLRSDLATKTVPFTPAPEVLIAESPPATTTPLYFGPDFYREVMPLVIEQIESGDPNAATALLRKWEALSPDNAEIQYGLALAYAASGDREATLVHARKALSAGLPASRFLAGSDFLGDKLRKTPGFEQIVNPKTHLLVHGPFVGAITARSARFWVRTSTEAEVTVTVRPADVAQGEVQANGKTSAQNDWTAVLQATGLKAGTRYHYSVSINGTPVSLDPEPAFRTYPTEGESGAFSIGFGSRSGYAPAHEDVWNAIRQRDLRAFLLLGDSYFLPTNGVTPSVQRYAYYRRQSSPPFRSFAASIPAYVTDSSGKLAIFRQNHVQPSSEGQDESAGIWFSFPIGDVTFFMLDCSTHRSRPADGAASMLGARQKQWLLDGLKNSDASFKVIAGSVPWAPSSSWWESERTWDGFAEEREEIFSFIEDNEVEGVVLVSGGTLNSTDVRRIPRPKGYDLYDLHSSRLTNAMESMTPGGAILNYDEERSFGLLEFDTTLDEPRLTYRMIGSDGKEVRNHDFILHTHDLDFGGLPDSDGLAVDLAFTKRPLIYGDGSVAERGVVKIRLENTSDEVQEGTLHFRSVPGSIVRFAETPEYLLDPGQVIERSMPIELVDAQVNDLIRIYAREGRDALRVGRKMRAPRGKSKGDGSLASVMELVDFRFKQTPGHPLLDKEDPNATEMGRIWFAMMDEKLVLRVNAFDAAPSRPGGRWTWNLWEGACLEVFGVNRGQKGASGESIAQIFLIPGVRAIPDTSILGKPMGYRLWRDFFKTKFASGYEGEPLPEIKIRSEFTNDGWLMEAMVPLKLPVFNPDQPGVPASVSSKRKLIHLYPDQLRIEFQVSTKLRADSPYTSHGTMLKNKHASESTENYAYIEWLDVAQWAEKEEKKEKEKE